MHIIQERQMKMYRELVTDDCEWCISGHGCIRIVAPLATGSMHHKSLQLGDTAGEPTDHNMLLAFANNAI